MRRSEAIFKGTRSTEAPSRDTVDDARIIELLINAAMQGQLYSKSEATQNQSSEGDMRFSQGMDEESKSESSNIYTEKRVVNLMQGNNVSRQSEELSQNSVVNPKISNMSASINEDNSMQQSS